MSNDSLADGDPQLLMARRKKVYAMLAVLVWVGVIVWWVVQYV